MSASGWLVAHHLDLRHLSSKRPPLNRRNWLIKSDSKYVIELPVIYLHLQLSSVNGLNATFELALVYQSVEAEVDN